jgi:hypothetical protein
MGADFLCAASLRPLRSAPRSVAPLHDWLRRPWTRTDPAYGGQLRGRHLGKVGTAGYPHGPGDLANARANTGAGRPWTGMDPGTLGEQAKGRGWTAVDTRSLTRDE